MKSDKPSANKKAKASAKTSTQPTPASAASPKAPAESSEATNAKKKAPAKKSGSEPPAIPPILLEGDQPSATSVSGPGQRYALGPVPPPEHLGGTPGELPEAYGTKRLLLAARDPHWLYARWDLSRQQQRGYNSLSVDHHLVLRVFINEAKGHPFSEVHVHPESTHWFIPVAHAGTKYIAELGYYQADGTWANISTSSATLTPPDSMSDDYAAEFATIPMDIPFAQLMELAQTVVRDNVPLVEVIQQLRASGYKLPTAKISEKWTPERQRALAAIITMDSVRRVWMGSLEITELIRRQLQQEISSIGAAEFGVPGSLLGGISSISSVTSPFGGQERRKGFWFNVNAELIIYGATEPDAQVTIGGRVIKLRPDGTFSYRFILPDGVYELPAVATSSDKTDSRVAELKFSRESEYHGEVGAHPQDPKLKPPLVENVS